MSAVSDTKAILLQSVNLRLRKYDKKKSDVITTSVVSCYRFQLHVPDRRQMLAGERDGREKAKKNKKKKAAQEEVEETPDAESISFLDSVEEEEEEEEADERAVEDDSDGEIAQEGQDRSLLRYQEDFASHWDFFSYLYPEEAYGFFQKDIVTALRTIKPQTSSGEVLNSQLCRMQCTKRPASDFGFDYTRMYPIASSSWQRRVSRMRILPIHLVPLFLATQKPITHELNSTVPLCYGLIRNMEKLLDHFDRDPMFLASLEQLRANTDRIFRQIESRSDSVNLFGVQIDLLERQLTRAQQLITSAGDACNVQPRLAALESNAERVETLSKSLQKHQSKLNQHTKFILAFRKDGKEKAATPTVSDKEELDDANDDIDGNVLPSAVRKNKKSLPPVVNPAPKTAKRKRDGKGPASRAKRSKTSK